VRGAGRPGGAARRDDLGRARHGLGQARPAREAVAAEGRGPPRSGEKGLRPQGPAQSGGEAGAGRPTAPSCAVTVVSTSLGYANPSASPPSVAPPRNSAAVANSASQFSSTSAPTYVPAASAASSGGRFRSSPRPYAPGRSDQSWSSSSRHSGT